MNIITTILLAVVGIVVLLLIIALFLKKEHYVKREIIINAPRQQVFNFLKLIKNPEKFNKWATTIPTGEKNLKELTEQLDLFMPGAETKKRAKEKRKLQTSLKGKESKQKSVL